MLLCSFDPLPHPQIYLDYHATTPIDPRVAAEMLPWLGERFGNAASLHGIGEAARAGVEEARSTIAVALGGRAESIVFTCENPRREVVVGAAGKGFTLLERFSPALVDWALQQGKMGRRLQESDQPDDPRDNLFGPVDGPYGVHGDFSEVSLQSSPYTQLVERHPWVKAALIGAGVLGALALVRWLGSDGKG